MQRFAFILGIVVAAAALVAAGWYLGLQQRVLTEAYAIPTIDKHISDVSRTAMLLEQIDSGRTDDARHMLQVELSSHILSVDLLLDSADARSRDLASKVFARIARYRAEHPHSYTGQLVRMEADVSAKVDSILQRAREEQKK